MRVLTQWSGFDGAGTTVVLPAFANADPVCGADPSSLPHLWVGDGSWGRNPARAGTTVMLSSFANADPVCGAGSSSLPHL